MKKNGKDVDFERVFNPDRRHDRTILEASDISRKLLEAETLDLSVQDKDQAQGNMFKVASKTLHMRVQPLWKRLLWAFRRFD